MHLSATARTKPTACPELLQQVRVNVHNQMLMEALCGLLGQESWPSTSMHSSLCMWAHVATAQFEIMVHLASSQRHGSENASSPPRRHKTTITKAAPGFELPKSRHNYPSRLQQGTCRNILSCHCAARCLVVRSVRSFSLSTENIAL